MRLKLEHCLLYAVTDTAWLRGQTLAQQVESALRGGATMVQLREKHLTGEDLEQEAEKILAICRQYGVPLLINDDVLLAKKIGADGVHVGQSDMAAEQAREILGPEAIIGVTARTVEQARAAEAAGADYLGSGAVFGTSTKADAKPMEHAYFQEICESVSIPVVAIGGITADNIRQLQGRKMEGFAIVRGIFAADDIEAQTKKLWQAAQELCLPATAPVLEEKIRQMRPVVQCITNIVTVNDCANALLAAGASPTMAHHPLEMEDFAQVTDALVCNLGASESYEAMLRAAALTAEKGHPVVIDPVGCASSFFRRKICMELIDAVRSSEPAPGSCCLCIRGNASEIRALAEHRNTGRGVDELPSVTPAAPGKRAASELSEPPELSESPELLKSPELSKSSVLSEAPVVPDSSNSSGSSDSPETCGKSMTGERFALQTGAIVITSGATDYVTDGIRSYAVQGGTPWMARVTGTGCMLSSLLGSYLAAETSALSAACCCSRMKACGGEAAEKTVREEGGTGTFHIRLMDALSGPIGH